MTPDLATMRDWYIERPGHWVLCRVTGVALGYATVILYTGEPEQGMARKGVYGWIVEARTEAK